VLTHAGGCKEFPGGSRSRPEAMSYGLNQGWLAIFISLLERKLFRARARAYEVDIMSTGLG
jgi:hypothetical protein